METIRPIRHTDNAPLAKIIRDTLMEFDAAKEGTVYYDEATDHLFELFQHPSSAYFVAEKDGKVVGGGGVFPTDGLPPQTCELVKMYLLPEARGKGLGKKIIDTCIEFAATHQYEQIYLESMPELKKALVVYEKLGFKYLDRPLGNSGHTGCSLWMLRKV